MPCPVCDHTMHGIVGADRVFWCPRCGTLKDCGQRCSAGLPDEVAEAGNDLGVDQPKLIERAVRLNEQILDVIADCGDEVIGSGIRQAMLDLNESIGGPSNG